MEEPDMMSVSHIVVLLLLLSGLCVGQIWPNWLTLWGLHTEIPTWIWAKTPVLWTAESSQNEGWDLSQCWVLGWCLLQWPLLTGFFQIQWPEFIQQHQHGPAAGYMTGSLTRAVPEILWARSCGCLPWAGESNSSSCCHDLPVSFLCL